MALTDKTLRVLIKFDADTSKAKEGMRGFQQEADKTKKSIGGIGEAFGALDGPVERAKRIWGDLAGVVSFAGDMFKSALEQSRLEAGALGVSIDGLRKASGGLRTDLQLQRDALEFNQTALKGNQKAMENVERAQRALIARGNDEQKVHEAVTQALTKLEVDGLRPFGIAINKAGLSMDDNRDRAELLKRVYAALKDESKGVNDEQLTQQERLAQTGVTFENAVDQIKKALGELVVAMAPLIKKAAELIGYVVKVPGAAGQIAAKNVKTIYGNSTFSAGLQEMTGAGMGTDQIYEDSEGIYNQTNGLGDYYTQWIARTQRARRAAIAGNKAAADAELAGFGGPAVPDIGAPDPHHQGKAALDKAQAEQDALDAARSASFFKMIDSGQGALGDLSLKLDRWFAEQGLAVQEHTNLITGDARIDQGGSNFLRQLTGQDTGKSGVMNLKQYGEDVLKLFTDTGDAITSAADKVNETFTGETLLERWFGKLDDFSAYHEAFSTLTGAVTSGMDAWIEHSMSVGDAIKKSIGKALEGEAGLMAVEAIKHLAYALGSLAFGDGRGAAAHGAAAAKFGAGAAFAMVVAREFGHGGTDYKGYDSKGGSGGGGGAGPAPYTGSRGSSPVSQQPIVYVVGDPMDTEANPRTRQNNARRIVESVTGNAAGGAY